MSSPKVLLALAVVAALAPMALQATETKAGPSASRTSVPGWLPIADLVDANGSVHWDALEAIAAYRLHLQIDQVTAARKKLAPGRPADECVLQFVPSYHRGTSRPTHTLANLIDHSPAIVLGRVTAFAQGLYNGILGTLLEVEVERSYKVSGPNTRLHLFVEETEVTLDGAKICKSGLGRMPTIGARLLLFYFREISDKSRDAVLTPIDDEIIFELEDGTASIPAGMSEISGGETRADFRQILQRVEEGTAQTE